MATMPKSRFETSVTPDWYRGNKTKLVGDYFGSSSSIAQGETYVTQDAMHIVHRDPRTGLFSVSRNACAHAGARLLSKTGVQDPTEIRCPVHQWLYKLDGTCIAKPFFEACEGVRLHAPTSGVWNGYVIGYAQAELDRMLAGFGASLGHDVRTFGTDDFMFMEEIEYPLPYPCELMMVNYFDGYHVPLCHAKTFDAVADATTYRWELSPMSERSPVAYSIQEVRKRSDVRTRLQQLMQTYDSTEEVFGWARFQVWMDEEFPRHGVEYPIDREVFALWAAIYGNGYLMPELYCGGLFLAVSYLVNVDPKNPEVGNKNFVEYYVHKNVPPALREKAYRLFRNAYEQSAREDDEICETLWAGHRLGGMEFPRAFHTVLEAGDAHWRQWFLSHFVKG